MFIDASALTAMLADEEEAPLLLAALFNAPTRVTSPLSIWEAALALARLGSIGIASAHRIVNRFLEDLAIDVAPATREIGDLAIGARARYGKGRHKAALNSGDCFFYADCRHLALPLLYKGDDFALIDLA